MRFKSVVSAVALTASLGFAGFAYADTMVGAINVTDVDLPRVTEYCAQLASGMEEDTPTAGSIDTTETQTDTSGDSAATTDQDTADDTGDDEPTLDLGQISLENCVDAGLVTEGEASTTTTTN